MAREYEGIASALASRGRGGDSMLMHVNPIEVEILDRMAPGKITINPDTGQPEALAFLLPLLAALPAALGAGATGAAAGAAAGAGIGGTLAGAASGLAGGIGSSLMASLGASGTMLSGMFTGGLSGLSTGILGPGLTGALGLGAAPTTTGAGAIGEGLAAAVADTTTVLPESFASSLPEVAGMEIGSMLPESVGALGNTGEVLGVSGGNLVPAGSGLGVESGAGVLGSAEGALTLPSQLQGSLAGGDLGLSAMTPGQQAAADLAIAMKTAPQYGGQLSQAGVDPIGNILGVGGNSSTGGAEGVIEAGADVGTEEATTALGRVKELGTALKTKPVETVLEGVANVAEFGVQNPVKTIGGALALSELGPTPSGGDDQRDPGVGYQGEVGWGTSGAGASGSSVGGPGSMISNAQPVEGLGTPFQGDPMKQGVGSLVSNEDSVMAGINAEGGTLPDVGNLPEGSEEMLALAQDQGIDGLEIQDVIEDLPEDISMEELHQLMAMFDKNFGGYLG